MNMRHAQIKYVKSNWKRTLTQITRLVRTSTSSSIHTWNPYKVPTSKPFLDRNRRKTKQCIAQQTTKAFTTIMWKKKKFTMPQLKA